MSFSFEEIINNSVIDIIEYDMQVREEMSACDRIFPYYVMSYLKQGEALLRVGDKKYLIKPQDIIIVPSGVRHDHLKTSEEDAVFLWWHFNIKLYDCVDVLRLMDIPIVFKMDDNAGFERAFSEYMNIEKKKLTLCNSILKKAKGLEIMAYILGAAEEEKQSSSFSNTPELFKNILEFVIYESTQEMTLDLLSKKYNLHPTYISNRFKYYFGISPVALWREKLFQKAKFLLSTSDSSVSEIADSLNFQSVSIFTRFFVTKAGVSPSLFRKSNYRGF